MKDNLITIAIRSEEQAKLLAQKLKAVGIATTLSQVGQQHQSVAVGTRIRIDENDLQRAIAIIESPDNQLAANQNGDGRHILVPFDFSDYSLQACRIAFRLSEILQVSKIVLLHAYVLPNSLSTFNARRAITASDKDTIRHFKAALQGDIHNLDKMLQSQIDEGVLNNVAYEIQSVEGVPEEAILDYCEQNQPIMVIMGTRDKRKKDEEQIGSVTAEVIERATVPVLAIPENTPIDRLENVKNVMFATNFDDRTLHAFRHLMEIFKSLKFNLLIAHFESTPDEWNEVKLSGLAEYCRQNYPQANTTHSVIPWQNPTVETFDEVVRQKQLDLIVLNTHRRRLFARLFNPSVARKMVYLARTPILVFRT